MCLIFKKSRGVSELEKGFLLCSTYKETRVFMLEFPGTEFTCQIYLPAWRLPIPPAAAVGLVAAAFVLMGEVVRSSMAKRVGPLRKNPRAEKKSWKNYGIQNLAFVQAHIVLMSHKPTWILPILKHPVTGSQHWEWGPTTPFEYSHFSYALTTTPFHLLVFIWLQKLMSQTFDIYIVPHDSSDVCHFLKSQSSNIVPAQASICAYNFSWKRTFVTLMSDITAYLRANPTAASKGEYYGSC